MDVINKFAESKSFSVAASKSAQQIVTMINNAQFNNWRTAATVASKGRQIYNALLLETKKGNPVGNTYRVLVDQNATIIKTLPHDIAEKTTRKVSKLAIEGMRASEIAKEIQKDFPKAGKASAKLIARTEVSKASTALTHSRSQNLGIDYYVWRTSEDARVRSSHAHMDDVIVPWNSPPSPELLNHQKSEGNYHAGNIYNCRCYAEPLVSLSLVKWPHKVYHNGSISMFTRSQFEALLGMPKSKPVDPVTPMMMKQVPKAPVSTPKPIIKKDTLPQKMAKAASKVIAKTYEKLTDGEVKASIDKAYAYFSKAIPQKDAFKAYTGSSYSDMNDYMRGKIPGSSLWSEVKQGLITINEAYKEAPKAFERPTQVFRGTGLSHLANAGLDRQVYARKLADVNAYSWSSEGEAKAKVLEDEINNLVVGKIIEEKALTSTSYRQYAFGAGRDVQLTIDVHPDLAEAIQLAGISNYGTSEAEILFNTGMLNEVLKVEVKKYEGDYHYHFHMRNVGHVEKDLQELKNML